MMTFQQFPLTRRQFKAAISQLNRSRLAKPSTGSALENISKLLQVVAIFVGGAWVLMDYLEFKKSNNELMLQQGRLAVTTAQITLDLNKLKLERSTEGRMEVAIDGSVVRSVRLEDGTFLHRYHVSLEAKNISESTVFIPAIVVEFFIGTMPKDELKPNEALYINPPNGWLDEAVPGRISWTREGVYAHSQIESPIDDEVEKNIQAFPPLGAAGFAGNVQSGATTQIGLSFLIRSRPDAVAGAVITFWDRTANSSHYKQVHTNYELLSEAEDALALKKDTSDSKDPDRGAKPKYSPTLMDLRHVP
jgi:hypothetical protein